jgi:hypothetical protein
VKRKISTGKILRFEICKFFNFERELPGSLSVYQFRGFAMFTFMLWLLLLFVCWPLALLALVLYPLIWLLLLPFRILGIAVEGVLELVKAIIFLPARVLRGPARA